MGNSRKKGIRTQSHSIQRPRIMNHILQTSQTHRIRGWPEEPRRFQVNLKTLHIGPWQHPSTSSWTIRIWTSESVAIAWPLPIIMTSSHPPDVGVEDEPSKNAYFDSPKFTSDKERLFETIHDDPQQVADALQALHQTNDSQRIPFAQSLSVFAATRMQRSSRPIDTFYNTGLLVVLVNILSQRESYVSNAKNSTSWSLYLKNPVRAYMNGFTRAFRWNVSFWNRNEFR